MMRRLRKGVSISISLSFRCNIRCPYCADELPTGDIPVSKERTLDELKLFINTFPYKLQEVKLTGGSPEMHPDFVEFVNWMLDKGIFVLVTTNLFHFDKLNQLKKSYRLILASTYHHAFSLPKWLDNYNKLKQKYRVLVDEIDDYDVYKDTYHESIKHLTNSRALPFSRMKPLCSNELLKQNKLRLRISPDLKIYPTCYDVFMDHKR